ncbi:MAG: hypothetical protein AB8F74_17500 [Saprospiraceae bacterium]
MNRQNNLAVRLELVWWLFTFIVLAGVLIPVHNTTTDYPFWIANSIFVIVFITLTRYVFLLRHTFLADKQTLKVVLFFLSIPIVFFLVSQLYYFQTFLDEKGVESFLQGMPLAKTNRIASFIRTEMMMFGIGSIIIAIIFPFRMLLSYWKWRNRGVA